MSKLDREVASIVEDAEVEAIKREIIMEKAVQMMMTAPAYRWLRNEIMTGILCKSG